MLQGDPGHGPLKALFHQYASSDEEKCQWVEDCRMDVCSLMAQIWWWCEEVYHDFPYLLVACSSRLIFPEQRDIAARFENTPRCNLEPFMALQVALPTHC